MQPPAVGRAALARPWGPWFPTLESKKVSRMGHPARWAELRKRVSAGPQGFLRSSLRIAPFTRYTDGDVSALNPRQSNGIGREMLEYSDCKIDTITIEARYDPAFALWDKAGEIWAEIQSHFPELLLQNGTPAQQLFESPDISAATEVTAFRASCRGVDAEKKVAEVAQTLLQVCSDRLKVAVFTRVGLREIRSQKFVNKDEANSATSSLISAAFTGSLIGDSKISSINCAMKQESRTSGLSVSIRTEERETKATIPWTIRERITVDPSKECVVVFDSDYYTIGATQRETLNMEEWGKQGSRTIKRYWKSVLQ
jgi:hypothetical protein